MTDEEGNKIYERRKINTLATDFYKKLYSDEQQHGELGYKPHNSETVEPFLYEELKYC